MWQRLISDCVVRRAKFIHAICSLVHRVFCLCTTYQCASKASVLGPVNRPQKAAIKAVGLEYAVEQIMAVGASGYKLYGGEIVPSPWRKSSSRKNFRIMYSREFRSCRKLEDTLSISGAGCT